MKEKLKSVSKATWMRIAIIVLSVLCFILFGMALFYNAQYNDLEKLKNNN